MAYDRTNIQGLAAYVPGEQPQDASVVKLNTNENPYPPSAAVLQAIASVSADALRRYPPPVADGFRRAAAKAHGLTPDHVIATNGGDELLRLALTTFCPPQSPGQATPCGGVAVCEPTYSLYPVLAEIQDTPVHRLPLEEDWSIPAAWPDRLLQAGCRLAIVVNPHAPSGRLTAVEELAAIARRLLGRAVLLIDEAYVDFASHDALPLLAPSAGLDNVLLLRSLSKGYSLAGLRFGYGLGHPGLIAAMTKAKDSYNTDVLAQAAAIAALEHRHEARRTWQAVIAERNRLTADLQRRGFHVWPSQSNFLLAQPPAAGPSARELYEHLKSRRVFVRYFDQDRLRDKLRITIGTPQQDDALLAALDA